MTTPPFHIECFEEPSFGENAYVVSTIDARGDKIGWIVDPSFPPQVNELLDYVKQEGIRIERVILTHGHLDHIAGVDEVRKQFPGAQIAIADEERDSLSDAHVNLSGQMGVPITLQSQADEDLPIGGPLKLGSLIWQILDVAGHSPAGRALYCQQAGVAIVGDALFAGSIGRYDFPGSSGPLLLRNIRANLLTLPGETLVYPGHGPKTSIQNERKLNPYLTE